MKKVTLALLAAIIHFSLTAQESSYSIHIQLDGYGDSIAYLGNYFGDKMAITDTSYVENGEMLFSGKDPLMQGVYFLVGMKRNKLFEFLIGDDQQFEINSSMSSLPNKVNFKGSDENDLFYTYLDYNKGIYNSIRALRSEQASLPPGHDSIAVIRARIDKLNEESINYKLRIIDEYPETVLALLFNVMREPEVPDFLTPDGRQDSLASYLYYRNHYWEYIDIADDRFLRTPVFHRKMELFIDEVLPGHPDTLINQIDKMIAKTSPGSEMQNYLLWYFTDKYETSRVMGYDKIFVHMVDSYFTDQDYEWLHPTVKNNMIKRANQMRNVLLGEYAPALIMGDTSMQFKNMHDIQAEYLVVFFWSSTCGECKHEAKVLDHIYKSADIDLKIYAVNTDTVFSNWKDFIVEKELDWINVNGNLSLSGDYHRTYDIYSTPVIFLLDSQKAILAKRISAEQLPGVINRHKKVNTK